MAAPHSSDFLTRPPIQLGTLYKFPVQPYLQVRVPSRINQPMTCPQTMLALPLPACCRVLGWLFCDIIPAPSHPFRSTLTGPIKTIREMRPTNPARGELW